MFTILGSYRKLVFIIFKVDLDVYLLSKLEVLQERLLYHVRVVAREKLSGIYKGFLIGVHIFLGGHQILFKLRLRIRLAVSHGLSLLDPLELLLLFEVLLAVHVLLKSMEPHIEFLLHLLLCGCDSLHPGVLLDLLDGGPLIAFQMEHGLHKVLELL